MLRRLEAPTDGAHMAKKRPSVQKREREMRKRQREMGKAAKAAEKRERRLGRETDDPVATD